MRLFVDDLDRLCSIPDLELGLKQGIESGLLDSETTLADYIKDCSRCGLQELAISEMSCKRFLYLFACPEPISLEQVADEFDISLHRNIPDKLIVTDSDTRIATIILDPENAGKLYRFVENETAECQEL